MASSLLILNTASGQPVLCFLSVVPETSPTQDVTEVQAIGANSQVIVSWPDQRVLDFQTQNFPYLRSYFSIAHTPAPSRLPPGVLLLGATDCVANSNLFISADAKGHDNVSSFGKHRCLACELFQHLGCLGPSSSTLRPHRYGAGRACHGPNVLGSWTRPMNLLL